jgi:hypothetical protein
MAVAVMMSRLSPDAALIKTTGQGNQWETSFSLLMGADLLKE